jgi:hypothetical protein
MFIVRHLIVKAKRPAPERFQDLGCIIEDSAVFEEIYVYFVEAQLKIFAVKCYSRFIALSGVGLFQLN